MKEILSFEVVKDGERIKSQGDGYVGDPSKIVRARHREGCTFYTRRESEEFIQQLQAILTKTGQPNGAR